MSLGCLCCEWNKTEIGTTIRIIRCLNKYLFSLNVDDQTEVGTVFRIIKCSNKDWFSFGFVPQTNQFHLGSMQQCRMRSEAISDFSPNDWPSPLSCSFTHLDCCANVTYIRNVWSHNALQKCLLFLKDHFVFFLYHS